MTKYAIVKDGIVQNIVTADAGTAMVNSYIYADDSYIGVGFTYSEENGFRPPKPYPSWVWNYCEECGGVYLWMAPVPFPADGVRGSLAIGNLYEWNEETQSWDIVESTE